MSSDASTVTADGRGRGRLVCVVWRPTFDPPDPASCATLPTAAPSQRKRRRYFSHAASPSPAAGRPQRTPAALSATQGPSRRRRITSDSDDGDFKAARTPIAKPRGATRPAAGSSTGCDNRDAAIRAAQVTPASSHVRGFQYPSSHRARTAREIAAGQLWSQAGTDPTSAARSPQGVRSSSRSARPSPSGVLSFSGAVKTTAPGASPMVARSPDRGSRTAVATPVRGAVPRPPPRAPTPAAGSLTAMLRIGKHQEAGTSSQRCTVDLGAGGAGAPLSGDALLLDKGKPVEDQPYLQRLTKEQRDAATASLEAPLAVVACAGSGKTLALTARATFMVQSGVPPTNVLVLAFTRKAAGVMRRRIEQSLPPGVASAIPVSTFHRFCLDAVRNGRRRVARERGVLDPGVRLIGGAEQRDLVAQCVLRLTSGAFRGSVPEGGDESEDEEHDTTWAEGDALAREFSRPGSAGAKAGQPRGGGSPFVPQAPPSSSSRTPGFVRGVPRTLLASLMQHIRKQKTAGIAPEPPLVAEDDLPEAVYAAYNNALASVAGMDVCDLIPECVKLWQSSPSELQRVRRQHQYVLVDEYQDVNRLQIEVLRLMSAESGRITVCGDDDQSIYGWRGSTSDSFPQFFSMFKPPLVPQKIMLVNNFRSTGSIVEAAAGVIGCNPDREHKPVVTSNPKGRKIAVMVSKDPRAEADRIAEMIAARRAAAPATTTLADVAVLCRTRRVADAVELAFRRRRVPVAAGSPGSSRDPYRSAAVRDVLSYLRLIVSGSDNEAFLRVMNVPKRRLGRRCVEALTRMSESSKLSVWDAAGKVVNGAHADGIGASQVESLRQFIATVVDLRKRATRQGVTDTVRSVIEALGEAAWGPAEEASGDASDWLHAVCLFVEDANGFQDEDSLRHSQAAPAAAAGDERPLAMRPANVGLAALSRFVRSVDAAAGADDDARRQDAVSVTTVHQAKGREWPTVFIVRVNEGVMPLPARGPKRGSPGTTIAEERRVMYVAMTRAQRELFISVVRNDGKGSMLEPSRFLDELPKELLTSVEGAAAAGSPPKGTGHSP